MAQPDFAAGVEYWDNTPATVSGVLGGFGSTTPVPRLDQMSSRLILLSLLPELSLIPSAHAPPSDTPRRSYRAMDAGAGIGRITSTVLLPFFDRIDLVEPVGKFLQQAKIDGEKRTGEGWKLLKEKPGKSVRLWQAGLQYFDPSCPAIPLEEGTSTLHHTLISSDSTSAPLVPFPDPTVPCPREDGYDVCWLQWFVGHCSDEQLVSLLKRCFLSLRRVQLEGMESIKGYIIVKENICGDEDGTEKNGRIFDGEDSSITRYVFPAGLMDEF